MTWSPMPKASRLPGAITWKCSAKASICLYSGGERALGKACTVQQVDHRGSARSRLEVAGLGRGSGLAETLHTFEWLSPLVSFLFCSVHRSNT